MKWKRNKKEIETRAKWQLLTTAKQRSTAHSVHVLTPKSDKCLISPYTVSPESNILSWE